MSGQSILVILFVGLIAGWLAGHVVRGTGFGIVGDIVIGVIGAVIGGWLLPRIGIQLGAGIVGAILDATVGAIVLLIVASLLAGGTSWEGNRSRRWASWGSRR